jgi:hypothetical protein
MKQQERFVATLQFIRATNLRSRLIEASKRLVILETRIANHVKAKRRKYQN